jgi:hypothetical protein
LSFATGPTVDADFVIVTLPFPILRDVTLDVHLPPRLRQFIAEAGLGHNEKILAGFNARPWRQDHGFVKEAWADLGIDEAWDETQRQPERRDGALVFFFGGGNAVSVRDVFVPEALAHTAAKPLLIDRPLFRVPSWLLFSIMFPAVAFGVLETALQSTTDDLGAKVASLSGLALRDQAPAQELVANSDAALRAVRAGLVEAMAAVWDIASTGAEVPVRLRAQVYASRFYALDVVRDTISRLYARGTRAAFVQGHPVERALRNLHAISFGAEVTRHLQHSARRVLMGGTPAVPVF